MDIRLFMRHVISFLITVTLVGSATVAAQDKKPPKMLVFPTKNGDVVFLHAAHLNREKGECTSCHNKLWPQSTEETPKSNAGCGTCHQAGGSAFEMEGNCVKCHPARGGPFEMTPPCKRCHY